MSAVPLDYRRILESGQDIISDAKMLYKLPDKNIIEKNIKDPNIVSIPKSVRLKAGEMLFK